MILTTKDDRHRAVNMSAEVQADGSVRLVILVRSPSLKYTVLETAMTLSPTDAKLLAGSLA